MATPPVLEYESRGTGELCDFASVLKTAAIPVGIALLAPCGHYRHFIAVARDGRPSRPTPTTLYHGRSLAARIVRPFSA